MLSSDEIKSLFETKQYFELSQNADDTPLLQDFSGLLFLETQNWEKAEEFFKEKNKIFQYGFCRLLQGDKITPRRLWYSVPESPAVIWGKVILGVLDQKLEGIPSFLQVRNFLESTLTYLFRAKQFDFAYKLIGAKEFFADCNIESYKYIARVLMDNGHEDLAFEYFDKSIDVIPQDYESFFHLGELYFRKGDRKTAIASYTRVLELNPYHTPAAKILKNLINNY